MTEKRKNLIYEQKGKILWALSTVYAGSAVCYLLNMAGFAAQVDGAGFTQSALSVLVFVIVGHFLRSVLRDFGRISDAKAKKRRLLFALFFGSLLGLSFIWGYEIRMKGMTPPGYIAKLWDLIMALGLGVAFMPLTSKWFAFLDDRKTKEQREELPKGTKRKCFWYSWLGIVVCWIPVFLAYYPAIMSYDFHRQSAEAYNGYIWFNDHHPLIHTFLIRVFLLLGKALGAYEIGMAIFSALQMLILAAVLAYSCNVIGRITKRIWPVVMMAVIYGILPVHPILAMSMTKDILFTAFFLLFVLLIWERRRLVSRQEGWAVYKRKRAVLWAAILLTGILMMLLRNNAVYAFVVFAVFYVLISSGERLRIAILCAAIVVCGMGCKAGIREAMDAGKGSTSEMFSVMMQQFARVGNRQSQVLTEEDYIIINKYVPEELWSNYNPTIADSVKGMIAAYYYDAWKEDIPGMLVDWVKIGTRYPNEYIDAFLALTSGYWFLDDVSHAEVLGYGPDTNLGLLYTFNASNKDVFEGVESKSFLPGLLETYQKIVNGNSYYGWPIVSILFKPAFYCWLLILVMISWWYRKTPQKQLLSLLPLLYLLTMVLGPVVNFRYIYPIMVVVPVLLAEVLQAREKE